MVLIRKLIALLLGLIFCIGMTTYANTVSVTDLYEVGQNNVALTTQTLPSPPAGEGSGVRGRITNQYIYSPYGIQKNFDHPTVLLSPLVGERLREMLNQIRKPLNITHNQYGYTGQTQDPSTGLMMLGGFRNYAPGIGRFIQPDTYNSFSKHHINNPLAYVAGNPIAMLDPTGHMGWLALLLSIPLPEEGMADLVASDAVDSSPIIKMATEAMQHDESYQMMMEYKQSIRRAERTPEKRVFKRQVSQFKSKNRVKFTGALTKSIYIRGEDLEEDELRKFDGPCKFETVNEKKAFFKELEDDRKEMPGYLDQLQPAHENDGDYWWDEAEGEGVSGPMGKKAIPPDLVRLYIENRGGGQVFMDGVSFTVEGSPKKFVQEEIEEVYEWFNKLKAYREGVADDDFSVSSADDDSVRYDDLFDEVAN